MAALKFDLSALAPEALEVDRAPTRSRAVAGVGALDGDFWFPEVKERGAPAIDYIVRAMYESPTPWTSYCTEIRKYFLRHPTRAWALKHATWILYALSMLVLVAITVFIFGFRRSLLSLGSMDAYAWSTFAVIGFGEFVLVAARFFGRWTFCGDQKHTLGDRGRRIGALWGMIKRRDAFGNGIQAFVVVSLQLVGSAAQMAGLLLCMEEMMEPDDDRQALVPGWTIVFSYVMFAQYSCAMLDVERLVELDAPGAINVPLELSTFRVLWMTTVVPLFSIGFGILANRWW